MVKSLKQSSLIKLVRGYKIPVLIVVVVVGLMLRFAAAAHGHNYDYESFRIVARIMREGGNVYAETSRYNYGPVWMYIVSALDRMSFLFTDPDLFFRFLLAGFLSLVDLGIMWILLKRFGTLAGILFFLSPISIIITGFHSQFDNLAILVGLISVLMLSGDSLKTTGRRFWVGLVLLGLSLTIKHILIFYPFWLAIKSKDPKIRVAAIAIPLGVFAVSFLPFLPVGYSGIRENVLIYVSVKNAPLLNYMMPAFLSALIPAGFFWLLALGLFGLKFRKKELVRHLLLYLSVFLIFSPSVLHHYLAIVVAPIAVFPNLFYGAYTLLSTYLLSLDNLGMNISAFIDTAPQFLLYKYVSNNVYHLPILLLFWGLIWFSFKKEIKTLIRTPAKWFEREITHLRS
ncbi:MAG: hypothetical protein ACE5DX_04285 [Candidatus Dojkabacteria bacterium]